MAFFDDLMSAFGGGGNLLATGLNVAGNLLAGDQAQQGYADAAAGIRADNAAARAELAAAKQRGLGYIDKGVTDYGSTIAPLMTPRPILLPTYRGLTTQQQMGQDDLLRGGQAMLASSGLRGAGRAGVGTVLDSLGRYQAGARDTTDAANRAAKATAQQGADAARTGLATIQANAGTAKANTEIGVGSQNAGNISNTGNTLGNIAVQSGNTGANMITSTAQTLGSGLQFGSGYNYGNSPNQPPPTLAPGYATPWGKAEDDNQPKV